MFILCNISIYLIFIIMYSHQFVNAGFKTSVTKAKIDGAASIEDNLDEAKEILLTSLVEQSIVFTCSINVDKENLSTTGNYNVS